MRTLVGALGWVVAGALTSACGDSAGTPGRIAPDGTVTAADPAEKSQQCSDMEIATYTIDPAVTCELANSLARDCKTRVCKNGETGCSGYDATERLPFGYDGDGFLDACKADKSRMAKILCFKTVSTKSNCGPID